MGMRHRRRLPLVSGRGCEPPLPELLGPGFEIAIAARRIVSGEAKLANVSGNVSTGETTVLQTKKVSGGEGGTRL